MAPLKDSLRDPRERLMNNAEALAADVDWKLPGSMSTRVAPALIVQLVSKHGSFMNAAQVWISEKGLHRNHVANEVVMLSMVMDRMITSNPEFVKSEGCEIMARRIYALRRAFLEVASVDDWKQPKGTKASQWKSKVRWDLANEIDWRTVAANDETLPAVEKELQSVLQGKALFAKYLDKAIDPAKNTEES